MTVNARSVALEALLQVSENEGYSNIVIDKTLRKYELDKRDSALASIIFYGTIEKRITIDYYLSKCLDHPAYKINEKALEILRSAVYQIMFLEKIPESAAVNEAVNLAKEYKLQFGFINAVLRKLIKIKDELKLPEGNSVEDLSIIHSVPKELIALWLNSYGLELTLKILEDFSKIAPTFIRVNNTKITDEEFEKNSEVALKKSNVLPHCYKLFSAGDVTSLKCFEEGLFHVQDISSQLLCNILAPKENEVLMDVCSAPGGKTFTLSEIMNGTGTVFSYDLYKGRVKLIRAGAYRLGLKNVMASMRDALSEKCEIDNADKILCDVPCSGFGVIRRKPEIRYKDMAEVKKLPEIQYAILSNSSRFIKKGGILAYSTCTLNPKENGEIAEKFLKEHSDFEAYPIKNSFGIKRLINEPENQLTVFPGFADNDGFFISLFKKK